MAVQQLREVRFLEAFVLHDVAPMTGRVANRKEDRLVFLAGTGKRLVAPWIPVNRIVFVLEEVGTGFGSQTIGHDPIICEASRAAAPSSGAGP
jgi:hypothetical protein